MAKRTIGRHPKAFRKMAVERLKGCDNIVALSAELGVHRRLLYKWRDQLEPIHAVTATISAIVGGIGGWFVGHFLK